MKRALAVAVVFCMSINSFAAIVADNDGSAFITKAEFDSLKNSFQSQIDNYNSSIDSKIDGAIAAYLAGISTGSKSTIAAKNSSIKKLVMCKELPINTWGYPMYNMASQATSQCTAADGWNETWFVNGSLQYNGEGSKVIEVDAGTEGTTMPDNVVWRGVTNNAKAFFNTTIGFDSSATGDGAYEYYLSHAGSGSFHLCYILDMAVGYYANVNDKVTTWWPIKWYYKCGGSGRSKYRSVTNYTITQGSFGWDHINQGDNKYYYPNILIWKNSSNKSAVIDTNWSHTLRTCPDATMTRATAMNKIELTGNWGVIEYPPQANSATKNGGSVNSKYANAYNTTNTGTVIYPGVVNKSYNASEILQWKDSEEVKVNDKKIIIPAPSLLDGYILGVEAEDVEVQWTPTFIDCKVDGSPQTFDINVMFSLKAFGDSTSNVGQNDILKATGQTSDYLTTTNGKVTWKAKMPKAGVIYCKWWPKDTTIQNKKWECALDLENSGTYIRSVEK